MIYSRILPQRLIGMFNIPVFISSVATPSLPRPGGGRGGRGGSKKTDWGFKDSIPVELQLQRLLIR